MNTFTPIDDSSSVSHATIVAAIEQRVSTNFFDSQRTLSDEDIAELVRLATRAPTAFNFQNWRFIAVRTPDAKQRLRQLAWDQPKVTEAAVTFIVCGVLPKEDTLLDRLKPSITAGIVPQNVAEIWVGAARNLYADSPKTSRDEAVRSATFGATTLMFAATAFGLASGPMIGFDADGVSQAFGLGEDEIPVMLLTVGYAAPGNWPQKPRRPVSEVLTLS